MRTWFLGALLVLLSVPVHAQDLGAINRAVREERAKYPPSNLSPAQLGQLLNDVAAKVPGWALLLKSGGSNCPQPVSGTPIACDILIHRDSARGCDVLASSETLAAPQDCALFSDANVSDRSRYLPPMVVTPGPTPQPPTPNPQPPTPNPEPGAPPDTVLLLRIVSLLEEIKANQATQNAALERAIVELKAEIAKGIKIRW